MAERWFAGERPRNGDRQTDIAYGGVLFVNEDGLTPTDYGLPNKTVGHSGWPVPFAVETQVRGFNLLPYSSMYRREVWQAVGGYHRHCRTAEDADFWVRASSYGFRPRMVTTADTLIYRNRPGSMSRAQGSRQWIRWFPWGADASLMPAGAATPQQLPVPSFDPPAVSVIIPVGPGHERMVQEAVDSVEAQSFRNFEVIVVNDSGAELAPLPSWVRVLQTEGGRGVAYARNQAIRAARADLYLPLDADDILQPDALQWLLTAHVWSGGEIIYSDFFQDPRAPGEWNIYNTPNYDPRLLTQKGAIYPVTALTPKAVWEAVGGYDETLPCWEDWAFTLAATEKGFCSQRIAAPLWTYRKWTGSRRESNQADFQACKEEIKKRLGHLWTGIGGKTMAGCGCSAKGAYVPPSGLKFSNGSAPADGALQVQYTGNHMGAMSFTGATRQRYRFDAREPLKWVLGPDVAFFRTRPDFIVLDGVVSDAALEPELISEGPPQVGLELAGGIDSMDAARDFGVAAMTEAAAAVAVMERPDPSQPESTDPESLIAAFRGLGMSEDVARKRAHERLGIEEPGA